MPTVSGRVVFDINRNANSNENVVGMNNIPVTLQNTATLNSLVVLTNTTGDYSFINVPPGSYRIVESYGLAGGIPTPGDFNLATVHTVPPAQTPPVQLIPTAPPGATNIDCVTPNTILVTVAAADITDQYIFNGPVAYTSLAVELDPCTTVLPFNLVVDADGGTFGSFPAGALANTGPSENPYPAVFPDFTYVVPDPSKYTPIDGEFTLQNTMNDAMSNVIGAWWRISDHSTGNETGRMMIVNEDDPGDIIFRTVVAVRPHASYLFSTWILNLFRVPGYPGPEFAVRVLDEEGNALYDAPLGFEIPENSLLPVWKQIGGVINSRDNSELIIEFFSQGEAVVGDDFAIDDIGFHEILLPTFTLNKTTDKTDVALGEIVTFTTTIHNPCVQPLQNARFFDYLPIGFEFVAESVTVNGVPNPNANPLIGFFVPDISGSSTLTVSFQAMATALPSPNPAVNQAMIQYVYTPISGGIQDFYQLTSNEVTVLVQVPGVGADLSVVKTALTQSVRPCGTAVYAITVTNRGPDTAQNVVVTDPLPAGLCEPFFSADGRTWQPWQGSYSAGTLGNGSAFTILIKATVDKRAAGTAANTARINSATPDPNSRNNRASAAIQVSGCATHRRSKRAVRSSATRCTRNRRCT